MKDVAPKFAQLTRDVVFADLWRRPDLAARDRSLVTIAAIAAAVTHLSFYAGWSKATRAMDVVARTLGGCPSGDEQAGSRVGDSK